MTTQEDQSLFFEEETLSTIEALQRREVKYACDDYCRKHGASVTALTLQTDRKLMLKWSYNVVDYFNLNRETAAIAFSYSDRFLQTHLGPEFLKDTEKYQLLCIVSLYLAVKVHETASLTPKVFVEIGHGHFSVDQMEAMERKILTALGWGVNPPTALGFVRLFLDLIPEDDLDRGMKATAYMLARAQTERAVGDYSMLTVGPSKIAFASVQNSMEALGYNNRSGSGNKIFMSTAAFFSCRFVQQDLNELRVRLSDAITFETSMMMSLAPQHTSSRKTSTKTKADNGLRQESTTPRSVLCQQS